MTRIEAIRQRAEQATKGPWEFRYATGIKRQAFTRKGDGELKRIERKDEPVVSLGDDGACGDPECCGYPSYHVECSVPDGEFISHAREDVPYLLTLWDTRETALRALVEQWNKEAALTGKANTAEEAFGLCVEALSRLLEQEP